MTDTELCGLCRQTRTWHEEHRPHHEFQGPNEDPPRLKRRQDSDNTEKTPSGAAAPQRSWPFNEPGRFMPLPPPPTVTPLPSSDMVLRLALIEAGVITAEQLDAAEAKLRTIGAGGSIVASFGGLDVHLPTQPAEPS